ncbi:NAD(P)H-hydrate dehydratase [Sediminibacillus albus]|uniref:Bifunctional NAD(P)H-hydrate repair enzyme n=1 Tax=Sediminibacillus albus TaxID=407036 RepID=A0A1G9AUN8_9BACI|nr:NAD(P)H-hydrate dehydratase [Sediminibacillus albus]SDK31089.1 NAD(P)H-hydrate epimerase [Sediminibacillus albus]
MHIVTAKEMYEADCYAIEKTGMEGKLLMENAGRAAAAKVEERAGKEKRILVMAGGGSNGGDGFVIARNLLINGYRVSVLQLVPDEKITGDAAYHKLLYENTEGAIERWESPGKLEAALKEVDIVIDAMLGIGTKLPLREPFNQAVQILNGTDVFTISIDIPSGVPADEGTADVEGVIADYTIIIEQPKQTAFIVSALPFYGQWEVVKIGIPPQAFQHAAIRLTWGNTETKSSLPNRNKFSHKGSHGKGLLIGGSLEMPGSIALTTRAALRAGAGLITAGTLPQNIPVISAHCSEATYVSLAEAAGKISNQELNTSGYDAVAVGMGMGREETTAQFTRNLITRAEVPVLIDADGLHHVKRHLALLQKRRYPTVLTPHPGEMAMLTGFSVQEITQQPFSIAKQFAINYNVYLVLKGAITIVTDPEGNQWVNTSGNAGLAKGGSGDALSGILLAMMMQNQTMQAALSNGCYIHGMSADQQIAKDHSQQDLLAHDVIDGLASVFRAFS